MDFIDKLLDRITERMVYIFLIGILVGMCSTILQRVLINLDILHVAKARASNGLEQKLAENQFHITLHQNSVTDMSDVAIAGESASYVLMSPDTGMVYAEKAMTEPKQIASLTKLMTAVVAIDLLSPDRPISVTKEATKEIPTKIGMQEGEVFSLNELLSAVLLTSANDGAHVLADEIDKEYGIGSFISAMNMKAKILGMNSTHFDNAQGFDSYNNFSTAYDLAILGSYILSDYPAISAIVLDPFVTLEKTSTHRRFSLYNWNGLLGVYPGTLGMKTGNTPKAGKTALYVVKRGSDRLLVVLLGASTDQDRDIQSSRLFDYGFNKLHALASVNIQPEQLRNKYLTWPSLHH